MNLQAKWRCFKADLLDYGSGLSHVPCASSPGPFNIPMTRRLVLGRLEVIVCSFLSDEWIKLVQILQSIRSARLKLIDPQPIADANYRIRKQL